MKVEFGDQIEANGLRTYAIFVENEHVGDVVGSSHILYDGDPSVRRGLRGQAYRIMLREEASQSIRDMLAPAMPDDGRSFFTITMARNAIRDLANNRPMRLPEGWAPPKVAGIDETKEPAPSVLSIDIPTRAGTRAKLGLNGYVTFMGAGIGCVIWFVLLGVLLIVAIVALFMWGAVESLI